FFLPVHILTIPHIPWVQHNCPIPPGLEKEVCEIIHKKIKAGIYEPSNSTYHLQWFCILKKNGKLRIVHSLELLNHVTICHSGVPPFPDHVAESFAGCICGTTLNLYFFELLNRILQWMKYCGGTFSGHKLVLFILAVDTSYIAVGYYLCQCTSENHKKHHYNHFESIMLNNREARFSQLKLELYGLYQALQALQMYLIGIRNLIIEVNACYIKGMLQNPDIQSSASMNCWIMAILMFHFELIHIKGTFHGPDGLLQHPLQPSDPLPNNSNNSIYKDWINCLHSFIHQVQLLLPLLCQVSTASCRLPPLVEFPPLQPLATFTYLAKKYNLHHIWISGYNKYANGIVKQPHFDVHQALFKAVDGDQSRWSTATYAVFWSECVTVCKQMGCSPYYAMTGIHSLLPANIVKVTYLQPLPNSFLSTTNLITC
ncbi:hypothetical protein J132_07737, partial [Termitomyces sp. J132]